MNIYDKTFFKAIIKINTDTSKKLLFWKCYWSHVKKLTSIRGYYDFFCFRKWHCVESWSGRWFSFCLKFPNLYSFPKISAYAHSLIHLLTHSFILPTFTEHTWCLEQWVEYCKGSGWLPGPLVLFFPNFPTWTSTTARAPSLEVITCSTLHPLCQSCCWCHLQFPSTLSLNIPLPSSSWFHSFLFTSTCTGRLLL